MVDLWYIIHYDMNAVLANNNFNNNRSPNFTIWTRFLGVTQKSYPCMNWESAHVWQIGK